MTHFYSKKIYLELIHSHPCVVKLHPSRWPACISLRLRLSKVSKVWFKRSAKVSSKSCRFLFWQRLEILRGLGDGLFVNLRLHLWLSIYWLLRRRSLISRERLRSWFKVRRGLLNNLLLSLRNLLRDLVGSIHFRLNLSFLIWYLLMNSSIVLVKSFEILLQLLIFLPCLIQNRVIVIIKRIEFGDILFSLRYRLFH